MHDDEAKAQEDAAASVTGCRHPYQDFGVVGCSTSHEVMTTRIVPNNRTNGKSASRGSCRNVRRSVVGLPPVHSAQQVLTGNIGTVTSKAYVQYSYDREKREARGPCAHRLTEIISSHDGANVVPISRRPYSL